MPFNIDPFSVDLSQLNRPPSLGQPISAPRMLSRAFQYPTAFGDPISSGLLLQRANARSSRPATYIDLDGNPQPLPESAIIHNNAPILDAKGDPVLVGENARYGTQGQVQVRNKGSDGKLTWVDYYSGGQQPDGSTIMGGMMPMPDGTFDYTR